MYFCASFFVCSCIYSLQHSLIILLALTNNMWSLWYFRFFFDIFITSCVSGPCRQKNLYLNLNVFFFLMSAKCGLFVIFILCILFIWCLYIPSITRNKHASQPVLLRGVSARYKWNIIIINIECKSLVMLSAIISVFL
jgi:hypothetical protein